MDSPRTLRRAAGLSSATARFVTDDRVNISIGLLRWKGSLGHHLEEPPLPARISERSFAFSPRSCACET